MVRVARGVREAGELIVRVPALFGLSAQSVGGLGQSAECVVLVQGAVAGRVCTADSLPLGVIGLPLHPALAGTEDLRDGGLPAPLVVLVGFLVGGVVDGGEQAGQRGVWGAVFVGDGVSRRVGGFGDSAQVVVAGGGGQAARAGGLDGAPCAVVFSAQP